MKKLILITFLLVVAIFIGPFIHNQSYLLFYGDMFQQQLYFYVNAYQSFHQGTLSFFEWGVSLGNNVFANSFYFLGSPFMYLTLLLPRVELVPQFFLFLNALKLFLAAVFAYLWLGEYSDNQNAKITGALVFAFSGWVTLMFDANHLLDAYPFFPLFAYYSEKYLKKERFTGLVLTVALITFTNFYFSYSLVFFALFFLPIRYFMHFEKRSLKHFLMLALKYMGYYALGIGIAGIILVTSFEIMRQSPRIGETVSLVANKWQLFRFISSWFTPTPLLYDSNAYISAYAKPESMMGWSGGMPLYSFILTPFLIFSALLTKFRDKGYFVLIYGLLIVFSLVPIFSVIFNGNTDTRWMFMIVLMNAYFVTKFLEEKPKRWVLTLSWMGVGALLAGLFVVAHAKGLVNPSIHAILKRNVIVLSAVVTLYYLLILFDLKKWMVLVVMFEAFFGFYNIFYNNGYSYIHHLSLDLESIFNTYEVDYLKEIDDSFYRIDTIFTQEYKNDGMIKNYPGFTSYHSVYNYYIEDFLNGRFSHGNAIITYQPSKYLLKTLLGSKYALLMNDTMTVPSIYYNLAGKIYQNPYAIELGYATTKTVKPDASVHEQFFVRDMIMMDYIVDEASANTDYTIRPEKLGTYQETSTTVLDGLDGSIYIEANKGRCFMELFTGDEMEPLSIHELGYTEVSVTKENTKLNVYCKNLYVDYAFVDHTLYYLSDEEVADWGATIQSMDTFTNSSYDGGFVTGNITIHDEKKTVFTQVPYDLGWKVSVDGQTIDYRRVNEGFIGFDLEPGTHTVTFRYVPKGFYLGLLLSGVSILMLGLLVFLRYQRKSKNML